MRVVVTPMFYDFFFCIFWQQLFVAHTILPHTHTHTYLDVLLCVCRGAFFMTSARQLHSNASFRRFFLNFKYVKRLFCYLYFVIYLFYIFFYYLRLIGVGVVLRLPEARMLCV